jgi:microcystin-dependent protein
MGYVSLPDKDTMLTVATATQDDVVNGLGDILDFLAEIDNRQWQPSTAVTSGDIRGIQSKGSGWIIQCTQTGTTGSSEPSWGAGSGNAVTGDGTANWTVYFCPAYNFPAGVIPTEALADEAVTAAKIEDETITAAKIAANTLTNALIAAGWSLTPTGGIMQYAGVASSPPAGWLYCNGTAVLRATYADLFTCIGTNYGTVTSDDIPVGHDVNDYFKLPDFRGMFLRGRSDGRQISGVSIDAGRTLGSYQADELKSHLHTVPAHVADKVAMSAGSVFHPLESGSGVSTAAAGGSETRPMNVAINYLIFTGVY